MDGAFSWTPETVGTNTITLRVSDNGTPQMSDSETITVQVLAPPNFTSSLRHGNNLELTWGTRTNQRYAVDYKDDLNAPQWTPLWTSLLAGGMSGGGSTNGSTNGMTNFWTNGFAFPATGKETKSGLPKSGGSTLSFTNSITNSPQRFFRIRTVEFRRAPRPKPDRAR